MNTPTTPAARKLQIAPVPACCITPGAMMNTDEAGVIADKVISRAPRTRRPRRSLGVGCAAVIGWTVSLIAKPPRAEEFVERVSKNLAKLPSRARLVI